MGIVRRLTEKPWLTPGLDEADAEGLPSLPAAAVGLRVYFGVVRYFRNKGQHPDIHFVYLINALQQVFLVLLNVLIIRLMVSVERLQYFYA